jgi:hypothetical protein
MQTPEAAAEILEKRLDPKRREMTVADAAAVSGLGLQDAERGLHFLVKEYRGHLKATEEGELLFKFPHGFSKPWEVPSVARKAFRAALRGVEGAARFVVRAWVAIVLVAYVAIFVALAIALLFARGNSSDDNRSRGGGNLLGIVFRVLGDALFWTFHPFSPIQVVPIPMNVSGYDYGYGYGRSRPAQRSFAARQPARESSPFYERVDRFFFGPKTPPEDDDAMYRAVVAEIRAQKGRIGLADVIRVTGKSRDEIDPLMSKLLLDYEGSVEVSEEGGIAYRFPEIRKTAGEVEVKRAPPIWAKQETPVPITGNAPGEDLLIGGLNAFNLLASSYVLATGLTVERIFAMLQKVPFDKLPPPGTSWALGIIPLVFSIALFLLPLGRVALRPLRERKAKRENGRRAILRGILENAKGSGVSDKELKERYRFATGEEVSDKEITKQVVALGGDVDLGRAAEGVRYRFPDLELEARAVEAEREAASEAETKVGKVVFSSED